MAFTIAIVKKDRRQRIDFSHFPKKKGFEQSSVYWPF